MNIVARGDLEKEDAEMVNAFYETAFDYVLKRAGKMGIPACDWEDFAQEVVIRAFKGKYRPDSAAKFTTWLTVIAQNERNTYLAKQSKYTGHIVNREAAEDSEEVLASPDDDVRTYSAEENFVIKENCSRILELLDSLPENYRVALLSKAEGKKAGEVAEKLGCKPSQISLWRTRGAATMKGGLLENDIWIEYAA